MKSERFHAKLFLLLESTGGKKSKSSVSKIEIDDCFDFYLSRINNENENKKKIILFRIFSKEATKENKTC